MTIQKVSINVLLALASLVATTLFWQSPLLLAGTLLIAGGLFIRISLRKHALIIYICCAFGGIISETIPIAAGAWAYTLPTVLGVPVWLPFLWGNAGMTFIVIADTIDWLQSKFTSR